jgi:hypothetical protein
MTYANAMATRLERNLSLFALVLSAMAVALSVVIRAPLWVTGVVAVLPWLPLFGLELNRIYRSTGLWPTLFVGLVVAQTAHVFEHIAQMIQLHLLGTPKAQARGIFGALDIEWVHFAWNGFVLIAVVALLFRYRSSIWLWLAGLLAGVHLIEHTYIMFVYLTTGVAGTPGLFGAGGALAGGLPLARPDLHMVYNLIETAPLLIALTLLWPKWRVEGPSSR